MTLKTWSFSKKHNSTAQPAGSSRDYNVVMKENTSIENPVFILGTGIDAGISYCQWSGNYYFVDDIVLISADQVELHCSIDALATHKTAIGNYSAFIERSASDFDAMMFDSAISQTQELVVERFNETYLFPTGHTSSDGIFILGVVGRTASQTGGISVYALTKAELETALSFMFDSGNNEYVDLITDSMVKSFFNPFQYIVFLRWYPLTKNALGTLTSEEIKFGWWKTSGHQFDKLTDTSFGASAALTVPSPYYTDFRGYDQRFTQYYIKLPTVGFITLDPSLLSNLSTTIGLQVMLYLDIITGDTIVQIEKTTGGNVREILGRYNGQLGANIPVGQVSSNMGSIAMGAVQIAAGVVTENPSLTAAGAKGVAGSYAPPPSVIGTYGSRADIGSMTTVTVICRGYRSGALMTNHYGRPLDQVRTINTLTGFIKCREASIALDAPDTEIDKINNYLNGGFYYD